MRISKLKISLMIFMLILGGVIFTLNYLSLTGAESLNNNPREMINQNENGSSEVGGSSNLDENNNPEELINQIENGTSELMLANSNPYDYIKDNEYYKELVKQGPDVLPLLENSIVTSDNNGLNEYLLAIAMEEIAKVNLKTYGGTEFGWETAKGFVEKWNQHLKNIPQKVNIIRESNESKKQKVDSLVELGVPAVPFIIDSIENGNEELAESLEILLENNPK